MPRIFGFSAQVGQASTSIVASLAAAFVVAVVTATGGRLVASEQPQIGIVHVQEATVRSGPGEDFYATSMIPQGTSVEIYRMAEDGWCGIRPLPGSFSYVRVEDVEQHSSENASVLTTRVKDVKTHVGSQITADLNVEYITLQVGERLKRVGGPVQLGGQRWYRIFPPSGEFRWIHIDELQLNGDDLAAQADASVQDTVGKSAESASPDTIETAQLSAEKIRANDSMTTQPIASSTLDGDHAPDENTGAPPLAASVTAAADSAGGWRPSTRTHDSPRLHSINNSAVNSRSSLPTVPIADNNQSPDSPSAAAPLADSNAEADSIQTFVAPNELDDSVVAANFNEVTGSVSRGSEDDTNHVPPTLTTSTLQTASPLLTAELEVALSQMVAQEVDSWQLAGLQQRAKRIAEKATDRQTVQHALAILDRIREFAEIKRRHHQLMDSASVVTASVGSDRVVPTSALVPMPAPHTLAAPAQVVPPSRHGSPATSIPATATHTPRGGVQADNSQSESTNPLQVAARGWLVPVEGSRNRAPSYALTSGDGDILYFVSASESVDLRPYQDRPVEVVGRLDSSTHRFALVAHHVQIVDDRF